MKRMLLALLTISLLLLGLVGCTEAEEKPDLSTDEGILAYVRTLPEEIYAHLFEMAGEEEALPALLREIAAAEGTDVQGYLDRLCADYGYGPAETGAAKQTEAKTEAPKRDTSKGRWKLTVFDFFFYTHEYYYEDGVLVKYVFTFSKSGEEEDIEVMTYEGEALADLPQANMTPEEIIEYHKPECDHHSWNEWSE